MLRGDFRETVQQFETRLITDALKGRSQAEAARVLGLPLRTLAHRMKTLGIKRRGYSSAESEG